MDEADSGRGSARLRLVQSGSERRCYVADFRGSLGSAREQAVVAASAAGSDDRAGEEPSTKGSDVPGTWSLPKPVLVPVHGFCRPEPVSVWIYQLVPDDDVSA